MIMLIPGVSTEVVHKEEVIAALRYVADILGRRARSTINAEVAMYRAGDQAAAKFWEGQEAALDDAVEFVLWYTDRHLPEDEREGYEPPEEAPQ